MRESPVFEVRLRRFDAWRISVALVAFAAVASAAAWAFVMASSRADHRAATVFAIAALLGVASVAVAISLVRVRQGVLSCRAGTWSFAAENGATRSGPLTVAIDLGAFLLLRLDGGRHARLWLPVQRRGLERDWHALRCAVYSPPSVPATVVAAPLPPE